MVLIDVWDVLGCFWIDVAQSLQLQSQILASEQVRENGCFEVRARDVRVLEERWVSHHKDERALTDPVKIL